MDTITPLIAFSKKFKIQCAVAHDKEDFEFTTEMMVTGYLRSTAFSC
ncbi:MAG: hypothetical protein VCA12_06055 [Pseudomonadales bacterium]